MGVDVVKALNIKELVIEGSLASRSADAFGKTAATGSSQGDLPLTGSINIFSTLALHFLKSNTCTLFFS